MVIHGSWHSCLHVCKHILTLINATVIKCISFIAVTLKYLFIIFFALIYARFRSEKRLYLFMKKGIFANSQQPFLPASWKQTAKTA